MPDNNTPDSAQQDNMLAEFSDKLLLREKPTMAIQDNDMRGLQETVLLLDQIAGEFKPSEQTTEKLRQNLAVEWQRNGPGRGWWAQMARRFGQPGGWQSVQQRRRNQAFGMIAVTLALAVVMVPLLQDSGGLTGTAGSPVASMGAAAILGIVGLLVWWYSKKEK